MITILKKKKKKRINSPNLQFHQGKMELQIVARPCMCPSGPNPVIMSVSSGFYKVLD